jgi:hypothetical protein
MGGMTIGAVAIAVGVEVETIRFSERAGLLASSPRTAAGYRAGRGAPRPVQAAHPALRLRAAGGGCACAEGHYLAWSKIAALEEQIAHLTGTRDALLALVARCPGGCGRPHSKRSRARK